MKKSLLILFFFFAFVSGSKCQQHELGLLGGVSYYLGDINPEKHFSNSKLDAGLFYRYNINNRWAFRLQGSYGTLENSDDKVGFVNNRDIYFKSKLIEAAALIEVSYYKFKIGSSNNFTPYLFAGVAAFSFNPRAEYDNQWYDLQSLNTEGQGSSAFPDREPYKLLGMSIPFGFGAKLSLGNSTVIALEWGLRKTFTDYIDDVSTTYVDPSLLSSKDHNAAVYFSNPTANQELVDYQRGNESTKDWYSLCSLSLSFKIKDKSSGCTGVKSNTGNGFKHTFHKIKNEILPFF